MEQNKSEQSTFMYNKFEGYEWNCPRENLSIPVVSPIHPFQKHLRFSWLGVYSRFTCKAVIFMGGMDNPSKLYSRRFSLMTPCFAVGIDVAKDSCVYAMVSSDYSIVRKPFTASNDAKGLCFVLEQIKKVENSRGSKPAIVLESTGHFSQRIFHFFCNKGFDVYHINPLIAHSSKKSSIRKVKTDKVDAIALANLFFEKTLRKTNIPAEIFLNLKTLSRIRCQLAEQRSSILNQLTAAVEQVAPLFSKIFDTGTVTALELLLTFPSPAQWINSANQEEIIHLLKTSSRRSKEYAHKKWEALVICAQDAKVTGIQAAANFTAIQIYAKNVQFMDSQIKYTDDEIHMWAKQIPDLDLLKSIPSIGEKLAPIILGEIGDISQFHHSKQLVAYCGIDPSVKESGNFIGTKNKVTKRGSRFLRRALYIAATTAIRKNTDGSLINSVIYEYYQNKIKSKPRKQALGAVMNKLLRIIYSVLKSKQPYRLITSQEQVEWYQNNRKNVA